jgi:lactoylglutathione lyase
MATSPAATHIRNITTVAVPVADPERALQFYVDTLGLEKRRDLPFGEGLRWIEVAPKGAATTIALAPPGDSKTGVDDLSRRGVDVGEIMRFPGVPPMFSLQDPEGNTLYIVESQSHP